MPAPLTDDEFLECWLPLESRLRAVEERYRTERLRPRSRPHPEGAAKEKVMQDLGEACRIYLRASDEQRAIMRAFIAWSYILPPYLLRLISRPLADLAPDQVPQALREGLAGAALENNKTDFRDMYMALGSLYLAAAQAGVDATPFFAEAATWSATTVDPANASYGMRPMREFLLNFKDSAFFMADVEPRLRG